MLIAKTCAFLIAENCTLLFTVYNERTIEYLLIDDLKKKLTNQYKYILPFYYWKSREGNLLSTKSSNEQFKVMAVFARRPKIAIPFSNKLLFKINWTVINQINILNNLGIPTIIGMSISHSIDHLNLKSPSHFYSIEHNIGIQDKYVTYDNNNLNNPKFDTGILKISQQDILDILKTQSFNKWPDLIRKIDNWRDKREESYNPYFSGGYKPIFLLLK